MYGRKSVLVFITYLIIQIFNGIIFLFAVNTFLPIQFGYLQTAISILSIFSVLSNIGLATAHVKIMAEKDIQNEAFTIFFFLKIILSFISTIIIVLLIFIQILNGQISNSSEQIWVLIIVYFQCLLESICSILGLSFRAKMLIAKVEIPHLITAVINIIFSIIAILIFRNFYFYIFGNIIANFLKLIFYILYKRNFRITKINYILLKRYLILSLFFIIPEILNTLSRNLGPLIFLNYYDEELLGIYFVITNFFLMLHGLENTFQYLLLPNLTNLLAQNKNNQIKTSIFLYEKFLTIFNVLIIISGILFSEFLIKRFLGDIYYEKGLLLFYGSLIYLMYFPLFIPYSTLVFASERMKIYTLIVLFRFVFIFFSWFIFIPIINITGIVIGWWILMIPNTIIIRYYCAKNFNIGYISKTEFIHLILAFFLFFISFIIAIQNLHTFLSVILLLIMVASYILYLFKTKILRKKDITLLLDLINPEKMVKYIKNELSGQE